MACSINAIHGPGAVRLLCAVALVLVAGFQPEAAIARGSDLDAVRARTAALIDARADWQGAAIAADRSGAERRMLQIAADRMQAFMRLVESSPAEALEIALPSAEVDTYPDSVEPYLEARRKVSGTLEIRYADYVDHARRIDLLRSDEGQWTLHYTREPRDAKLRTGASIVATGLIVGDLMALDPAAADATASTTAASGGTIPLPYVAGEQRVLVIPVNFASNTAQPYTVDYVRTQVFGAANAWYSDVSAGQTSLAGDVAAWSTLDLDPSVCDIESVAALADAAALAQGYDPAAYARIAYLMPAMICGWAGLAVFGPVVPSRTWLTTVEPRVVVHELGHNLGLHHSRGRVCSDLDPWSSACVTYEYGDFFDIMGNGSAPFNALQMRRLGYFDAGSDRVTTAVTASGSYEIGAYAAATTRPRALRIPAGVDPQNGLPRTLYVTLRQPVGRDATIAYAAGYDAERMNRGIVVNAGWEAHGDVFLVDSTPLSRSGIADLNDAPVLVGESVTDQYSGITIAPVDVVDGAAMVSVVFGTPPAPVPPADVPPVAVDDSAAVSAGSTVSIPVMANDYDPDGQELTVASVAQPAHGQVSVGAVGALSYRPARKFAGTDTFTYLLSDGSATDSATVTVTVTGPAKGGRGR
jgi:Bacterial Ig domain/Gametolysin peptidase M11